MTRLLERLPRRTLLAGALALLALPAAAAPAAFDLPALAALLAQRKSAEVRFTEERWVSSLDGPLRSSGTLSYAAPDRYARRTLEPRPESMVVEGSQVTLQSGQRRRQMAVDALPELAAMVAAVRGTLSGDVTLLQRHFSPRLEGSPALWTLTLVPLEARIASQLREIKIAGQHGDLRSVELWMAGGDRSLMSIELPKR